MVEKVSGGEEPKTWGFGVNRAPLWLFKALVTEAKDWNGDYWPVLVDWYKKAKEFDNLIRGGLPAPEREVPVVVSENGGKPKIALFGNNEVDKK